MDDPSQLVGSGLRYFCELFAIELRNIEAIGLAQQKMLEGMGALAQHQAEMAEGTLRRSFGVPAALPGGIHAATIAQITSLKSAIVESQANSNILSELAARSGGEVANILQSRMLAALDELKAALEHVVPEKVTSTPAVLIAQPGASA